MVGIPVAPAAKRFSYGGCLGHFSMTHATALASPSCCQPTVQSALAMLTFDRIALVAFPRASHPARCSVTKDWGAMFKGALHVSL